MFWATWFGRRLRCAGRGLADSSGRRRAFGSSEDYPGRWGGRWLVDWLICWFRYPLVHVDMRRDDLFS